MDAETNLARPAVAPSEPEARCPFADGHPLLRTYHDEEWGVPVLDGRAMWEALALAVFAAGLSWLVVLKKRETMHDKLAGFSPEAIARWSWAHCEALLVDEDVVRSRGKLLALVQNARAYEAMRSAGEDLASFVWSAASTPGLSKAELTDALVDALRDRGFRNIGPVIIHAWLQGIGVWNDHPPSCPRRVELEPLRPIGSS